MRPDERIKQLEAAARSAMDGVADISIIIRETCNPTSVLATDILDRLKRIHERLKIAEMEVRP